MKWSQGHYYTLKETPADAEIPSHQLMVRGGYIRKLAQGIYTLGPLTVRSLRKLEAIIREELEKVGCVEIFMPMVQPREIWEETGRWEKMGKGLLKFKNRTDQEWCLGATHEEVMVDYVRKDIKSYRDLPKNLFQIQTKYRDEIRPRFGLLRGREFIMKDAYSFDESREKANETYEMMRSTYQTIFDRLGLEYRMVRADSGDIGGDQSHEFHVLAGSGEDELLVSEGGEFAANVEICPAIDAEPHTSTDNESGAVEEFATPGLKTIDDLAKSLKVEARELVKTMFFSAAPEGAKELKPVAVLLRGSDEVNPIKLKNVLGTPAEPLMLTDEEVQKVTGAMPGSCGPVGLEIPVYMDSGVSGLKNYVTGANKDGFHIRNVNHERDFKVEAVVDVRLAREGDKSPEGDGLLKSYRGIEVSHIFYLGTVYSEPMGAKFLDKNGRAKPLEMGCFGLGVTRTIQAAVEQNHDKDGIIWPLPLAPFHVHICALDVKDEKVMGVVDEITQQLEGQGVEVLIDDRDERPGFKFKDADLLGMPVRLNVGGRGLANGEVELVERRSKEMSKVLVASAVGEVMSLLDKLGFKG